MRINHAKRFEISLVLRGDPTIWLYKVKFTRNLKYIESDKYIEIIRWKWRSIYIFLIVAENSSFRLILSIVRFLELSTRVVIVYRHPFISRRNNCSCDGFLVWQIVFSPSEINFFPLGTDFCQHMLFVNGKHSFSHFLSVKLVKINQTTSSELVWHSILLGNNISCYTFRYQKLSSNLSLLNKLTARNILFM